MSVRSGGAEQQAQAAGSEPDSYFKLLDWKNVLDKAFSDMAFAVLGNGWT